MLDNDLTSVVTITCLTGYVGWVEGGIQGQPVDPCGVSQPLYQGVLRATCVGDVMPRAGA